MAVCLTSNTHLLHHNKQKTIKRLQRATIQDTSNYGNSMSFPLGLSSGDIADRQLGTPQYLSPADYSESKKIMALVPVWILLLIHYPSDDIKTHSIAQFRPN
jgi:hypothetical protein